MTKCGDAGELVEAATALLTKYLAVEEQFAGKVKRDRSMTKPV